MITELFLDAIAAIIDFLAAALPDIAFTAPQEQIRLFNAGLQRWDVFLPVTEFRLALALVLTIAGWLVGWYVMRWIIGLIRGSG